ncbi:MAG: hypothetical protein ACYTF1_20135 [Planctomycetota bacterium]|jgi:hypothetical protein
MSDDWISVEHPVLSKNEKMLNIVIPLIMLILFSIIPLVLFLAGYYLAAIIGEVIVILITLLGRNSRLKTSRDMVSEIKFDDFQISTRRRNGIEEVLNWGDIEKMYKIGPGEQGFCVYMALYRTKRRYWYEEKLRLTHADGGFLIPDDLIGQVYSHWRNYYLKGGLYNCTKELEKLLDNSKKYIQFALILFLISFLNIFIVLFLGNSLLLILPSSIILPVGIAIILVGGIERYNNKLQLEWINQMNEDTNEYFPADFNIYFSKASLRIR